MRELLIERLRRKSKEKDNNEAMLLEWDVTSCLFVGKDKQFVLKNRLNGKEERADGTFEFAELNDDRLFTQASGASDTYELYMKGGRYMSTSNKKCLINKSSIEFMASHNLLITDGFSQERTKNFLLKYIDSDTHTGDEEKRFRGIFYNRGPVMRNINAFFRSSNKNDIKELLLKMGKAAG